ncbi:MAG: NAD(P)/FAD-dependent oxidoreductase [Spirochaetales bacterium]|nr:NAD(P)/FAD-dependent oxidoreductase [Spirochaetales bacterium]
MDYDAVVIGGGVIGSAIIRYLSLYNMKTLLVEKEEDISSGTTKANSGIVHAGYDPEPGTLKAKLNVKGAKMIKEESGKLHFDYKVNGAMVVSFSPNDDYKIDELFERGIKNGVEDMEIISGDEARRLEPNLSENITKCLYLKSSAIVCPFSLTQALSENAYENGAEFKFNTKVENVEKTEGGYKITTNSGTTITTRAVINAAGVYGDTINNMVSEKKLHITPRRGSYMLFDNETQGMFNSTIFQLPSSKGKGVLVTPTVHGNLMIGPNSVDIPDKDDTSTTAFDLDYISKEALRTSPSIPFRKVITSFSGLRAHEDSGDFIVGEVEDAPGFFNATGIESPGLSSSLSIGEMVARMVADRLGIEKKENPVLERKAAPRPKEMSIDERNELIKSNPSYGRIVCRCEEISEGEIIDAITRPLGARSLDGVKRRVRAGMGRCQGGFCSPKVMELIEKYASIPFDEITKNSKGSNITMEDKVYV